MRMLCFKCTSSNPIREQVWRLIRDREGFIGDRYSHLLFWMPEQCVPFALLIDPTLERMAREDYIV